MFLPFSSDSKEWEPHALALRRMAGIMPGDLIDPWKLAPRIGLTVADRDLVLQILNDGAHNQLLGKDKFVWSGGSVPTPLPDGSRLCIVNPTHSRRRNKITLMEEITHVYRNHKPSGIVLIAGALEVREYHAPQEKEAYGIGAATLIPWANLFQLLNSGRTIQELAELFDVTSDLIEYRVKITGGYRIYRARQRNLNVTARTI